MTEKAQNNFEMEPALIQLAPDAKVIRRGSVEAVARLCGNGSHAAKALKRADQYKGEVRFWYSESYGMLGLELLPTKEH